ncbi:long-chain-fatty-acid--CoA ligase [Halomarina oriensis]|uniref:AMP-binding protein n=1 Tax=Halomarina oriensis TaxID=671145 RepID=A0A6B0GQV7_9EURY|nr:long-chain fatty acid--CoA ligase [Halomarina oriensis]MWG35979.1 AMP-binding protein [Halomarina oriensis]
MANLVDDVAATVTESPDSTAVGFRGRTWSYEEFWSETGQFAQALADHGVEAGGRVALYLPNLPQYVTGFHATLRAGGVVVPMNPQYKAREIGHLLDDSGATVVVTLAALAPMVAEVREETDVEHVVAVGADDPEELPDVAVTYREFLGSADGELDTVAREDDDVACQPYTSGTTGTPKGVLLTHHNLAWNARATGDLMPGGFAADDRMLGVLPLFHIYGMTVTMLGTLFAGAAYYPMAEWDAQAAADLIEHESLTIVHGVPAMYNDLVNQPNADEFDLSSVRFANSGGSSLPIEVMRRFEDLYDVDLFEGYGLTETSPVTHANRPGERRPGSIGKPIPGVQSMVVDGNFEEVPPVERGPVEEGTDLDDVTGELVVSGPNVMTGYYGLPEANEGAFTDHEGTRWFHTGDVAYRDEDDFYYVVDREKHMIVTGGYNVYPREVEELLFEHEAIADAAVVGIPDDRRGETVKAFVVPTPDADVTPEEIREYCLTNLAEYKHPREVAFVEELPRTTTGKVQKFELRDSE